MSEASLLNRLIYRYIDSFPSQSLADMENLSDAEIVDVLSGLRSVYVAIAINRLNPLRASNILLMLPDEVFTQTYRSLDPVKAASLVSRCTLSERDRKLSLLSAGEQKEIEDLSSYPADSAGTLMDTSVMCLPETDTVGTAIRKLSNAKTKLRDVFVIDLDGKLTGYFSSQELLFSEHKRTVGDLMKPNPPKVNSLSPKDEVIEMFETFKTTSLPVTHIDGTVLGAIRYDSLVQAVQDQATEALASMVGASPEERAMSPPIFSVKKRLPWLSINLLTAFIASAVVGVFEGTIAKVTALAVLLPVVAGQSGNTGAQAMAVTMRGLALREIRTKHWPKVLFKELRAGFINGVAIALFTGVSVFFWSKNPALGAVISVAMIFSMVVASMSGAAIPIILTAMGRDPAQSSSVILTTVTDVMGFLSFLGLATIFSSMLV